MEKLLILPSLEVSNLVPMRLLPGCSLVTIGIVPTLGVVCPSRLCCSFSWWIVLVPCHKMLLLNIALPGNQRDCRYVERRGEERR
jgi:hypothetical protein